MVRARRRAYRLEIGKDTQQGGSKGISRNKGELYIVAIAKSNSALNVINYHKFHFTRVYPPESKSDSSNFNPIESWILGAQIVALNFQTSDLGMLLNQSFFMWNGGSSCGYILKP